MPLIEKYLHENLLIQWLPLICKAYLSEKILQLSGLCDKQSYWN
jgi:hypothetical protein